MSENRSTWQILGALLGLVLFIVVLYAAVGYFREGATELEEQDRAAGRPITLAESLAGEPAEAITSTTAITDSAAITGAMEVTLTAELTTTAATTDTGEVVSAATITTTGALTEPVPLTTTTTVTAEVTATTDVTVTQPTTETSVVTATTVLSEDADVVTTTAIVTTTSAVTATDELTATDDLSPTEDLTATSEVTGTAAITAGEAPPEVVAIVTKATCFACHVIPGIPMAVGQVGPDLTNIGETAATRIPDYTAEEYIHESLLNPNAFVAPECPTGPCLPNLMVQNLGELLTPEEIDTVVAYLLTLRTATQ